MNPTLPREKERILAGTLGALLFALAGGVLWYVLYQFGFLAGISGLAGVVCAIKGYAIFAKKESIKGVVIAVIAALLVMVLAWYLCLCTEIYNAFQEFGVSFWEAVQVAPSLLEDPEIASAAFGDLAMGLILSLVGAGGYVANTLKKAKTAKEAPAQPDTAVQTDQIQESEPIQQPQAPEAQDGPETPGKE